MAELRGVALEGCGMNNRAEFSRKTKAAAALRADGKCEGCGCRIAAGNVQYDHIFEASEGGGNNLDNCAVLCKSCHKLKTATVSAPRIAKIRRQRDKHTGAKQPKSPMPCGRKSPHKKTMGGKVVWRDTGEPVKR